MAVHGSSNVTRAGIRENIEQIAVSKSWEDPNQRYITEKLCYQFEQLWDNKDDSCVVITMPQAIRDRLLQNYHSDTPPTEEDLRDIYHRAAALAKESSASYTVPPLRNDTFTTPAGLRFEDGPFEHQGRAVSAWCEAGFQGILEMATGSGKTIAAMVSAHRLYEENKPLLIVFAAPYVPLIEQCAMKSRPSG